MQSPPCTCRGASRRVCVTRRIRLFLRRHSYYIRKTTTAPRRPPAAGAQRAPTGGVVSRVVGLRPRRGERTGLVSERRRRAAALHRKRARKPRENSAASVPFSFRGSFRLVPCSSEVRTAAKLYRTTESKAAGAPFARRAADAVAGPRIFSASHGRSRAPGPGNL